MYCVWCQFSLFAYFWVRIKKNLLKSIRVDGLVLVYTRWWWWWWIELWTMVIILNFSLLYINVVLYIPCNKIITEQAAGFVMDIQSGSHDWPVFMSWCIITHAWSERNSLVLMWSFCLWWIGKAFLLSYMLTRLPVKWIFCIKFVNIQILYIWSIWWWNSVS